MWPDQRYAPARGSFERPVPIVDHEVTDTPIKTLDVSCFWLPYIRGALQQLLLQATWQTDDPAVLLLQQERVFELIDLFSECSAADLPFACPYDWSFSDQEGWFAPDWSSSFGYSPGSQGHFDGSGFGWRQTDSVNTGGPRQLSGIVIDHDFSPDITVTRVEFDYSLALGSATDCPGGLNFDVALYNSGGSLLTDSPTNFCLVPTGNQTYDVTFGSPVTGVAKVRIFGFCDSLPNTTGTMDGALVIQTATVHGIGTATC